MCSEPFDECQPAGCVSAVKLAAGTAHACVVAPDGGVRCWGANEHGQLGVGDRENRGTAEAAERGRRIRGVELSARRVRHIACGGAHSCVIFDDGRVQCWGKNASGQLGVGDRRDRGVDPDDMGRALPFVDLGRREPIALALGSRHSCALIEGGWVKCWGENDLGQLGLGDTHDRGGEPQQMGAALEYVDLGDEPVIALGAGANHTCAVLAGGSVKCWGANGSGQLGVGDERDRGALPGQMGTALPAVLLRNGRAIDVSAGYLTSCALLEGGAVECWGSNWLAQLGIGRPEIGLGSVPDDVFVPVPLGTGRSAIAVSVGSMHTCALLDDRRVKCWGRNSSGELGVGDARASVGARVEHLGDALASVNLGTQDGTAWLSQGVRSGADFSCALLDGGAVKCWGLNDRGQLGIHQDGDRGTLPEQLGDELPPVALD
jgi:alpha-tubulin suppressor-like RCC1 family protein